ncbi:hypothetical protein [Pseudomonas phage vB_Pae_CF28b]|nr:hypothetical protein [Pseudomonas phage vB_Pae_CF28b]
MALSDERRGLGARNEAIRRAGGQRVEAERRGDQGLTAALNRLIEPERQARSLRKIDQSRRTVADEEIVSTDGLVVVVFRGRCVLAVGRNRQVEAHGGR